MEEVLAVVGVLYGAVFIWLTVRIVNRPKEWWTSNKVAIGLLVSPLLVVPCLVPGSGGSRYSPRSHCKNNLKQIGLALHNYADMYGSFPPAFIADKNGRPVHSWRVLILPFIEQSPLYSKYRFDEPWDGPNNSQLASAIIPLYTCPSDDHGAKDGSATMTSYVAVVGDGTAWPEAGTTSYRDIRDGTSNTLHVVEVANSGIHWMEPRDLHVIQMAPMVNAKSGQGISSRHNGGANGLICDGAVRFVPNALSAEDLRAWLTAQGGETSPGF
jgi:prepilin-type processing-associated H-X9-DG protein